MWFFTGKNDDLLEDWLEKSTMQMFIRYIVPIIFCWKIQVVIIQLGKMMVFVHWRMDVGSFLPLKTVQKIARTKRW
jgi:hypothetical protein